MRLSVSSTPSNTPSNTPSVTPTTSTCPCNFDSGSGFQPSNATMGFYFDGNRIVVGGNNFTSYNATPANRLIGIKTDGSIDNTFNTSGFTAGTTSIVGIQKQSTGKYLVHGSGIRPANFTNPFATAIAMFRYNNDGSFDSSYKLSPMIPNLAQITDCVINNDDSIVAIGSFTSYSGVSRNRIVKLLSDGTVDTTASFGTGFNDTVYRIVKQNDGKYVVAGNFTQYSGVSANRIIRLNSDFTIDNTFNTGTGFSSFVSDFQIQSDGKIVCITNSALFSGTSILGITRLNSDGSLYDSFGVGSIEIATINDIVLDNSENIYITSLVSPHIYKFNSDGTPNISFSAGTGFFVSTPRNMGYYNGYIYCFANFTEYDGDYAYDIAKLDLNGVLQDCTFTPITPSVTPTQTKTPTLTPSNTPPPTIYISMCISGSTDESGCTYSIIYADYSPNSFGGNPAVVLDDLLIATTVTDDVIDQTSFYEAIFSGTSFSCNYGCGLGQNANITDFSIDAIVVTAGTPHANYVIGGASFTGTCGPCATPTPTPTQTNTPTLTQTPTVTPTQTETACECWRFQNELGTSQDITYTPCGSFEQTITMSPGQILYKCVEAGTTISSASVTYVPCTNPVGCSFDADCNSCSF